MSVYTKVTDQQLERFLDRYEIGRAGNLEAVAGGITNTNYYLDTGQGHYVLTLYEHHSDDELDYMLPLQQHLADRGLRCSAPVPDRRGELYSSLNQRPAAIIRRLDGEVVSRPEATHCRLIGTELARFHLAGLDYAGLRLNPRGANWASAVVDMLEADLGAEDRRLVAHTLTEYHALNRAALPHGAIHADLFHDNALFNGATSVGIVDFDYACSDAFVFDLAVVINDWCIDDTGELRQDLVEPLIEAYQTVRPLQREELMAMPSLLAFTALRFWLSRLHDRLFPLSGELTYSKDPGVFREMLGLRREQGKRLTDLFQMYHLG